MTIVEAEVGNTFQLYLIFTILLANIIYEFLSCYSTLK